MVIPNVPSALPPSSPVTDFYPIQLEGFTSVYRYFYPKAGLWGQTPTKKSRRQKKNDPMALYRLREEQVRERTVRVPALQTSLPPRGGLWGPYQKPGKQGRSEVRPGERTVLLHGLQPKRQPYPGENRTEEELGFPLNNSKLDQIIP